jgi:hypothetical protein
VLLVALALEAGGCHNRLAAPGWPSFHRQAESQELQVEPRTGGQPADLKADEVIGIMRRIGFADPQILDLGPRLRDAVRTMGAAALVRGGQPEVLLAVNDGHVFVQSQSQGNFIYCMTEKRFIMVPPMPLEAR